MEDLTYYLSILGLIALSFVAIYLWRNRAYHIPNPQEAEGEVVEIESISTLNINPIKLIIGKRDSTVRYHPIVRFKLGQEKRVRFRNRKGYKHRDEYAVGQRVAIVYCQDNPLIAKIKE